ncbi:MAG: hypothetical protein WCG15_02170 [Actinomycetes bacterium]
MSLEDMSFEQRDQMALLMRELSDNPETRKEILRLTRKVKPGLIIPELDIEDHTQNAVSAANKRVEGLEAKIREKEAMEDLNKRRMNLIKKGLIQNESEIEQVEKIMLDKGITNHESAAEYWDWMKQSAVPTPTGYNPSAVAKFDLGKYYKNPVMAARDEASKALNELRRNPRPIGL